MKPVDVAGMRPERWWRLSATQRRALAQLLTVQVIATAASAIFLSRYPITGQLWIIHSALSGVPTAFVVTLVNRVLVPRLFRLPFLPSIVLRTLLLAAAVLVGFALGQWIFNLAWFHYGVADPRAIDNMSRSVRREDLPVVAFVFVALVVFAAFTSLTRRLGPGVLGNLLIGRYHRPRVENRIFMFLDLKGSTRLAETLGDLRFSALLKDFFDDLTPAILESGAEVSHYVGDEVVLTWTMRRGLARGNCLRMYFIAKRAYVERAARYRRRYGVVPDFRASLHAGDVVTTELGDTKSEIVHLGDVLNTASRIQSLCSDLGVDLLVSETLADELRPRILQEFLPMGRHAVKGKENEVGVATLPGATPVLPEPT